MQYAPWTGTHVMIFQWGTFAISTLVVAVRLYIDLKGIRKVAWYREMLVMVAWATFLAFCIIRSVMNDMNFFNMSPFSRLKDPEKFAFMGKLNYISVWMYIPTIYGVKLELLFLFHELAPRSHNPKTFWFIIIGWISTIAGIITLMYWYLFGCDKISDYWTDRFRRNCKSGLLQMSDIWGMNILSDLIIYIIPLFIIFRQKMMTRIEKLSAGAMFFLGFVNIMGAVFCLFGQLVGNSKFFKHKYFKPSIQDLIAWTAVGYFMTIAQLATAIWIVCIPQLKNLYRLLRGIEQGLHKGEGERDIERDVGREGGGPSNMFRPESAGSSSQGKRKISNFFSFIMIAVSGKREVNRR